LVEINASSVKELRERTGAGMMDCKKALTETGGNIQEAIAYLRERGLAAAAKRAGRIAKQGLVGSYIHPGGRVGVLLEVNCETDFVARTEDFGVLVHDLAMQVAAAKPAYVRREDIPAEIIQREKDILAAQAVGEGKPEKVVQKIVQGRIEKFFKEECLLEQPFVKNTDVTVQQLLNDYIARIGENIAVRRFARFELGEGLRDS